ncbi:FeoB-associated Cys-rich membrane protein [Clostridium sp.]
MEIFIASIIILLAVWIIYRSFKKSTKGKCNCGSCSSHCPMYKDKK